MKGIVQYEVVAGTFYPASSGELSSVVDGYLSYDMRELNKELQGRLKAIVVPHAGYIYSGEVAGKGFSAFGQSLLNSLSDDNELYTIFILASNHVRNVEKFKISVSCADYYKTPLGIVRVSSLVAKLKESDLFTCVTRAHESHVIEVELPFIQRVFSGVVRENLAFEIVPMIIGDVNELEIKNAASVINQYLNNNSLIVVSSDLSHYYSYDEAVSLDSDALAAITDLDSNRLINNGNVCGLHAVLALLDIARMRGWRAKVLEYKNSGDTAGSKKDPVVGYGAVAFY